MPPPSWYFMHLLNNVLVAMLFVLNIIQEQITCTNQCPNSTLLLYSKEWHMRYQAPHQRRWAFLTYLTITYAVGLQETTFFFPVTNS
jgi:hypothetical protein